MKPKFLLKGALFGLLAGTTLPQTVTCQVPENIYISVPPISIGGDCDDDDDCHHHDDEWGFDFWYDDWW